MATDIKLTPETLLEQSSEMASLQTDYESLFSRVSTALSGVNEYWSEAIASNFAGKITSAQKDFSSVANMLTNGSAAARLSAMTLDHGGSINSVLTQLMGGSVNPSDLGTLGMLLNGQSDLSTWITENQDLITSGSAEVIGELSGLDPADVATTESVAQKMASGDYEGAISEAGGKLVDIYSNFLSGSIADSSWVSALDESTGGALGLNGLKDAYVKTVLGGVGGNVLNILKDEYSGNSDDAYQLKQLGEMAWNGTAGSVIKTAGDAAYNVVSKIPIIGDYYTSQGVTDSEGALGVMLHDMTYSVTGDNEAADYTGNYYSNHGGVASGIVDGVADIGDYFWHNILGK